LAKLTSELTSGSNSVLPVIAAFSGKSLVPVQEVLTLTCQPDLLIAKRDARQNVAS